MSFGFVRPTVIDDTNLTSSTVPLETAWDSATDFDTGDIIRGTGDFADRLFEALQDGPNHPVTDEDYWLDIGPANRWAPFDGSPQSQATNADEIEYVFDLVGRYSSIGFENVNAETIRIEVVDATDGTVYDETFSMVSDSGITDWWAYYTEEIVRVSALTVNDLPTLYYSPQITVTLTDAGATVGLGEMILGLVRYVGTTQWGGNVGIQDYSRKDVNDFGVATVIERAYAKRANFQVWVLAGLVDTVIDLFAQYRATPLLFIGDEDYTSTAVFGFLREWSVDISYPAVSVLNVEIEGLA